MTTVIECRPPATRQPVPVLKAIKAKQQVAWSSGDYAVVGTTLQIVGEQLAEAMDLRAGQTVLDVAAGNGNATLAAARRWCKVTSTDYVASLLEAGRKRAAAEGLDITFRTADAEELPFADASFDAVVSTFGGMFSPDQDRTAAEMVRVCKSGGRIGLANWTPRRLHRPNVQNPRKVPAGPGRCQVAGGVGHAGLGAIDVWHGRIRDRGTDAALHLPLSLGTALPRRLPDILRAGPEGIRGGWTAEGKALSQDIIELVEHLNTSGDRTMVVPGEYLEVVITKR